MGQYLQYTPGGSGPPAPSPAPAGRPAADAPSFRNLLPGAVVEGARISDQVDVYTIQKTGVVEMCFSHIQVKRGLIYIVGGSVAGVYQAAAGTCNVGVRPNDLDVVRVVGDQNVPILISETSTGKLQSARRYVNGTAGDQLRLIYSVE